MPIDLPTWLTPGLALGLAVGALVLLVVAVRAVLLLRGALAARRPDGIHVPPILHTPPPAAGPPGTTATGTVFMVGGRTYTSMDQLPPEARKGLEVVQSLFGDADRDGVPDVLEKLGAASAHGLEGFEDGKVQVHTIDLRPGAAAPGDLAARLEELKRLLDRGLITAADFEAKKREILAGL